MNDNGRVAITVFDSRAIGDEVDGLYIKGKAREVTLRELLAILPRYATKWLGKTGDRAKVIKHYADFLGRSPVRMYIAIPQKIWLLGPEKFYRGKYLDRRVSVALG